MLHKLEAKKSKRKILKFVNEPSNRSVFNPTDRLDFMSISNRSVPFLTDRLDLQVHSSRSVFIRNRFGWNFSETYILLFFVLICFQFVPTSPKSNFAYLGWFQIILTSFSIIQNTSMNQM